jgi:orotate phosphoribosyltransferase
MTPEEVLDEFRATGALLEGHFLLTSGLHSAGYLQCARVLQHPVRAARLGEAIAAATRALEPAVVLSPALGGIIIGHEVARALGVRAIFAEREGGALAMRRGFTIDSSERVLVVEDVVTTGGSTRETMDVAHALGGDVVGAAAIIDRGLVEGLGVPFHALAEVRFPQYHAGACPLCTQGIAVVKPGSRAHASVKM